MRTLFVTHCALMSGAEQKLLRLLPGLGSGASALTFENGPLVGKMRDLGVPAISLSLNKAVAEVRRDKGLITVLRTVPNLPEVVQKIIKIRLQNDITVACSQKAFVICGLAQSWVRRPLVWSLNDILSKEHFSSIMRIAAVTMARTCATNVVVNSEASASALIAAGGNKHQIRVIYPGTDLHTFRHIEPLTRRVAGTSRLRIGCIGRLAYWKGQHVLLQALTELPEAEAWIVGDAMFGESDYEKRLRELASHPVLAGRVRFLGQRSDVPDVIGACDVIVHTSISPEPFGNVIVEGLASGRPVIATAGGGALEIIREGVDGLLVRPGDVASLVTTVRRLAIDIDFRLALAQRGRARAEKFRTETMVAAFKTLLGSLCDESVENEEAEAALT